MRSMLRHRELARRRGGAASAALGVDDGRREKGDEGTQYIDDFRIDDR